MKEYWNKLSVKQKAKHIFWGIVGLLVLLFAIFNWDIIELHLVFGKIEMPVTILILLSMLGGYGYARLFGFFKVKQKEEEIVSLKAELNTRKSMEKEQGKSSSLEEGNSTSS